MDEIRYIAGTLVGAGVDKTSLEQALEERPHFIACDAGSTDPGPFSLGSGQPAFAREAVKRDLAALLDAGRRAGIPVLIGSTGTGGADAQVDWTLDILTEIMREAGATSRTAMIYAEQDKDALVDLFRQGRNKPLDAAPHLDEDTIMRSAHIVGMMGAEPLQQALAEGVECILAGRCSDSALYAAMPILNGFPEGLAWHASKVVECGTMACETAGNGGMFVRLRHDHFLVQPFGRGLRCTPQSVAAHSVYEIVDPFHFTEASGIADITEATYEAIDPITVRVANSRFRRADPYTIKLEGAELVGVLLIIGAIGVPTLLILHDQLNIDEDSGALAFAAYQQRQLSVFLTYYALMAAGVQFLVLAPILYVLYARLQTPLRLMVLICMVLVGVALAVASSRWLIVLPYLAHIYTSPQTGAATRVALDVAYAGTSYFLGITIGEFIYNIVTGLWSLFLATMLLRVSGRKAWFHWIGILGGAAMLIGSFEQTFANADPGPLFRRILIAGIVAWMIWLAWLAITLLVTTSATSRHESPRAVQELE